MSIKETHKKQGHMPLPKQEQGNITELFERTRKFRTLEEVEAALQQGIYGVN